MTLLESHPAMIEMLTAFLWLHGAHVDISSTRLDLLPAVDDHVSERAVPALDRLILAHIFAGFLTSCQVVHACVKAELCSSWCCLAPLSRKISSNDCPLMCQLFTNFFPSKRCSRM
jgi:hypothetical protein